jgi:DNA-binding response OmpR family regulator
MPEMNGLELARRLADVHRDQASRVVLMTGGTSDTDVCVALQRTACPVVLKPIDLTTLRQVVAKICPGS